MKDLSKKQLENLTAKMFEKQYDYNPYSVTGEDHLDKPWCKGFKSGFMSGVELDVLKEHPLVKELIRLLEDYQEYGSLFEPHVEAALKVWEE